MLMPKSLKVLLIGSYLIDNELNRRALNRASNSLRVPVNVDMLPKAEVLHCLTTDGEVGCWDAVYMCIGTGLALERPLVKTLAWHPVCAFASSFAFALSAEAVKKVVHKGFCPDGIYSYCDSFGGMVRHFEQSLIHVCGACGGEEVEQSATLLLEAKRALDDLPTMPVAAKQRSR